MTITLDPALEAALNELARRKGIVPEQVALLALRAQLLPDRRQFQPRDEWERGLLAVGTDCGVSLSNWAVGSEGLYE